MPTLRRFEAKTWPAGVAGPVLPCDVLLELANGDHRRSVLWARSVHDRHPRPAVTITELRLPAHPVPASLPRPMTRWSVPQRC